MDVIVTGGRDYKDAEKMNEVLRLFDFNLLIHGGATGADYMAGRFCLMNGIECKEVPADWQEYGKAAGPIRNALMLDTYKNAIVIAFPGGRGTANCVKQALERNMTVLEVRS